MKGKTLDLTNKTFGHLSVLGYSYRQDFILSSGRIQYRHYWKCVCDCGKIRVADGSRLRNGVITSCGHIKNSEKRLKKGEASFNRLFFNYKKVATEAKRIFDLTKEQFRDLTEQNCHYCKIEPTHYYNLGRYGAYIGNGIDRKDNKLGYTTNNSLPCCLVCNRAKSSMSYEDFLKYIARFKNG